MQSHARGGLAKGTLIFSVPRSPGRMRRWNGILKFQRDNRHRPARSSR